MASALDWGYVAARPDGLEHLVVFRFVTHHALTEEPALSLILAAVQPAGPVLLVPFRFVRRGATMEGTVLSLEYATVHLDGQGPLVTLVSRECKKQLGTFILYFFIAFQQLVRLRV